MALLPLRKIIEPSVTGFARDWIEQMTSELADKSCDRAVLCRRVLTEMTFPQFSANWETAVNDPALPYATRLALAATDPGNVTLEPEYYGDCDDARFRRVKPLLWLWYSFDRTVAGGQNVWLGVLLRRLLASHIFKRCGENFKCFQHTEFSFGYNMEVGVLLDDRGGIRLGNKVSISDYANVYSHTHSIVEQKDVTNAATVIEDGVRITYHATVLAGVHVGENAMVGAMAMATKDVRPYHVYVGIPAKSVKIKPNAPPELQSIIAKTARERGSGSF